MVIVYTSNTGFTKKYADMLAEKTGFPVYNIKELFKVKGGEEIIYLGWIKAGRIQGLSKVLKNHAVKAVCATGTAKTIKPSQEVFQKNNKIQSLPFFYLQGGTFPVDEIKGFNGMLMRMFLKMLKGQKDKDEEIRDTIQALEQGFDGVDETHLEPVLNWINTE